MLKALFAWLGLSLCTLGYLGTTNNPVLAEARLALGEETSPSFLAQVTSDGTVNTQVTENGNTAEITEGETRGDNLFHSFEDFSVETGNEAFFNNADSISNIFSRVTGGNVSDIDGAIRANGSANLFLINPAGIVFGENASLNIGGSFLGSSASSILFEDGEFSATDLDNPPLLTVNAPIGLGFRDNPGDITNNSNLEVNGGETISLIGGDVSFDGGLIFAPGGIVDLGGLTAAGTLSFIEDGSLSFPENVARGNISLANSSNISVLAAGGGSIFVNARNLDLTSGSLVEAGISEGLGSPDAQAGNIVINATESVTLGGTSADGNSDSGIFNQVELDTEGNGGVLNITTPNLALTNGGRIATSVGSTGDVGAINIDASESVTLDGESSIASAVILSAGNGGALNITTPNLALTNGASVSSNTIGDGNAGSISINATESVTLDGKSKIDNEALILGNGGAVNITTANLSLTKGSQVSASSLGAGNTGKIVIDATSISAAGVNEGQKSGIFNTVSDGATGNSNDIKITTDSLSLANGGQVSASTFSKGNAGNITINATDISFDGVGSNGFASGTFSNVEGEGEGDAGNILIDTKNLSLSNGAVLGSSTFNKGNAGNITINATDISFDGVGSNGFASGTYGTVNAGATGNSNDIKITTDSLSLTNGGVVNANTLGKGNAGNITINATDISFDGVGSNGFSSGTFSNVEGKGEGDAGNILIDTKNLSLANGAALGSSTFSKGDAGNITINATDISVDGIGSEGFASRVVNQVDLGGIGDGGELNIATTNLSLTNGGGISAGTFGAGNGGTLNIDATESVTLNGNSSILNAVGAGGVGNGGALNITTPNLTLTNGSAISASTFGKRDGGNISINSTDIVLTNGSLIDASNFEGIGNGGSVFIKADTLSLDNGVVSAANLPSASLTENTTPEEGGNISLEIAKNLSLRNNSGISAQAGNNANSGNVDINTNFIVAFPNGNSDILASAEQGEGGNITINADSLLGIEQRPQNNSTNDINASSNFNLDGTININTSKIDPIQGATELPSNVVEAKQATEQTCSADREGKSNNGLAIAGRGGVTPAPDAPLNSENISDQNPIQASIPQPLETSQGKIQPARGIMVTKSGRIVLTAYRTDNAGERIPEGKINCGQI
jgi:filamentous hemagglutinin family protein